MEFDYDGGGVAKGGTVTLYLDGEPVVSGRVEQTEPFVFSADETLDIGCEAGSPVTTEYSAHGNAFHGEVNWVQIDTGADANDADHYISAADRMRVAMGLQ